MNHRTKSAGTRGAFAGPLGLLLAALAAPLVACGGAAKDAGVEVRAPSALSLVEEGGGAAPVSSVVARAPLTALVFFDGRCPVLRAHDGRLRALVDAYRPRGVAFHAVVSSLDANVDEERARVRDRRIGMPVVSDPGARLAKALGVEFSAHVVLFDREGRALYSGAIDDDRGQLREGAVPYARDAIDAALAGKPIVVSKTEALGCPLRLD